MPAFRRLTQDTHQLDQLCRGELDRLARVRQGRQLSWQLLVDPPTGGQMLTHDLTKDSSPHQKLSEAPRAAEQAANHAPASGGHITT